MENTHDFYNSPYTSHQFSLSSDFGSDTEDLNNIQSFLLQKTRPCVEDVSNYQSYKSAIAQKIFSYNTSSLTQTNCTNFQVQSKNLVKEVIKMQIELHNREVYHVLASEQNPALFILSDSVLITAEKVGEGAQSSVFRVNKISYEGSLVSKKIVKLSKISYASEFALLHSLKAEPLNTPYIDHIQAYYLIKNQNMHLAIFENSDADLAHVNFNKVVSPLEFIIRQVSQIVEGIRILHENNIVHRDIKGENCLINYEGVGKITDTGSAQQIRLDKEIHNIYCTPYYAPPFIWNTFDDQFHKMGYQGKDADVFSTGITLEFDCIIPLLTHYATEKLFKNSNEKNDFLKLQEKIVNARKSVNITSLEQLHDLDKNHPNRVSLFNRIALILPDRNELLNDTLAVIQFLEPYITQLESNSLKYLAKLTHKLINYNSNVIPSIGSVGIELAKMHFLLTGDANMNLNKNQVSPETPQLNRNTSSPIKAIKRFQAKKRSINQEMILESLRNDSVKKMKL